MPIRTATLADVPHLRGLFADMVAELRARFPETPVYPAVDENALDQFTMCLVDIVTRGQALWQVFIADGPQGPVGFAAIEHCRHPIGTPAVFGHVHWIYVQPSARSGRLATGLAVAMMKWCAAREITQLECEGSPGDPQHANRGWKPYRVRYQTPVAQLADHIASRAAAPPPPMTPARAAKVRQHVNGKAIVPRRRRRREEQPEA